ncbi:DUF3596 domain-containing protein [Paucibacter sp. O1-1]|nr:DUF3596 domain-containing protein [Paucibacter sp. O1-1]MDA3827792.1 DUF3596 domain-containing protein [Paucibacter sp. O1-1]
MGGKQREPGARREIACPRGVSIRTFKTEQRIQLAFSFRGVECRELLSPRPVTQTSVNLAGGLRAEIQNKIAAGTFHYADYFLKAPALRNSMSAAGASLCAHCCRRSWPPTRPR